MKTYTTAFFLLFVFAVLVSVTIHATSLFHHQNHLHHHQQQHVEQQTNSRKQQPWEEDMIKYSSDNAPYCQGTWEAPIYNETVWMAFRNKTLLNPFPPVNMSYNWYDDPAFQNVTWPDTVCAVQYPDPKDRSKYFLRNFSTAAEAEAAGAFVTHLHPCNLCSTTQDLSVYMQYKDLTNPGRHCGLIGLLDFNASVSCFQKIGFTEQCSYIWARDAQNTRKDCFLTCMAQWIEKTPNNVPYPNGTLSCNMSSCIACDEYKSGPIFKLIAGRTRRDSGLWSSIFRPADTIYHVLHYYY